MKKTSTTKKTKPTSKKKPVKSVGKPKKKVLKKPAVIIKTIDHSELGPKDYRPLIELLENKMQNSKSKFKFVYLDQVPYKTYVTVKRIDASVKIRPMTKYFLGLVSGKTVIVGTTEIPDRRTGKVEYAVKLPVALRTKSLSVRLYYADGCNVFVDYSRTYTFEKMKTFKKGETFKFEIDLHLDDTNPRR